VGDGRPCFVLAEGGVNHNGDPKLAEDLVRIAADCQADGIKFQKRTLHELLTRAAIEKPYVNRKFTGRDSSSFSRVRRMSRPVNCDSRMAFQSPRA